MPHSLTSPSPQEQTASSNFLAEASPASSPSDLPVVRSSAPTEQEWSHAAQNSLDALPHVWTRGLLYLLVLIAAAGLPWASLSKVDETGSARGRLEPKGRAFRLDAPVAGTVTKVLVREGQRVKRGQPLLELDTELLRKDLEQAIAKLNGQENRLSQLELVQNQVVVATRTQRLQNQAQIAEQSAQIDQIRQRLSFQQNARTLAQERFARTLTNVDRQQWLHEQGVVSQATLEEKQILALESQQQFEQSRTDFQQTQTELQKQQSAYDRIVYTGKLTLAESEKQVEELRAQIADLNAEIAQTHNQIQALQLQIQQRLLKAPADGTIFELPIDRPGAVVQPSQLIAQVAPEKTPFVLRAQMPSRESGFLRLGAAVKLKFDAYPFQDYGVVQGRLSRISPSSKVVDTPQGQMEVFEIEVALEQNALEAQNRRIPLNPGQTATAEVIIRQRRVIDFVLDPFRQLGAGGLKL